MAVRHRHCTSVGYDSAQLDDIPIGSGQPDATCQRIRGCDASYPLITCELGSAGHASNETVVASGVATLVRLLAAP